MAEHLRTWLLVATLVPAAFPLPIQAQEGAMDLARLTGPVVLDGTPEEAAWFYDVDPSGIRINSLYRDRWNGDDALAIYVDAFNDNQNAKWFGSTPAGMRFDLLAGIPDRRRRTRGDGTDGDAPRVAPERACHVSGHRSEVSVPPSIVRPGRRAAGRTQPDAVLHDAVRARRCLPELPSGERLRRPARVRYGARRGSRHSVSAVGQPDAGSHGEHGLRPVRC